MTGGTGGSGFTGGCSAASPINSLSALAGASFGSPLKFGLPPKDSEEGYVAGSGVGGQPVQNVGNPDANGGHGLILIEALHTLPTMRPSMAPNLPQDKVRPTLYPTANSKVVYKFPRIVVPGLNTSEVTSKTVLVDAAGPITVKVSASPNMVNGSSLFDGLTTGQINFVSGVCTASCTNPFSSGQPGAAAAKRPCL